LPQNLLYGLRIRISTNLAECHYNHFFFLNQIRSAAGMRKKNPQRIG
jgi:superoxide dismutase